MRSLTKFVLGAYSTIVLGCTHPQVGFDYTINNKPTPIRQAEICPGEELLGLSSNGCKYISTEDNVCTFYTDVNNNGRYDNGDKIITFEERVIALPCNTKVSRYHKYSLHINTD